MSEQAEQTEETTEEATEQEKKGAEARAYDTVALRELRRARRLIRAAVDEGSEIPAEATIAVGIAEVLATLDLAAAIREHS